MIGRCYDEKTRVVAKSYEKATVCTEWLRFSNFLRFYNENHFDGSELDKDLLSGVQQHYSPETCCFLPKRINILLSFKSSYDNLPTGVSIRKKSGKYMARCQDGERRKFLGYHDTPMEAHKAWQKEKISQIRLANKSWLCETSYNEKAGEALLAVADRIQHQLDNGLETINYFGGY